MKDKIIAGLVGAALMFVTLLILPDVDIVVVNSEVNRTDDTGPVSRKLGEQQQPIDRAEAVAQ